MDTCRPEPWTAAADGYVGTTRVALAPFSRDALEALALPEPCRVLDLASGPGSFSQAALSHGHTVHGVDFSPAMERHYRARLGDRATFALADGQTWRSPTPFQAAGSLFGLLFFPDPAAGLANLFANLVPGGRVALGTWQPTERSSYMRHTGDLVHTAFPDLFHDPRPPSRPLATPAALHEALTQAGFVDIEVHERRHARPYDRDLLWRQATDGFVHIAPRRHTMCANTWHQAHARALTWMDAHHDPTEPLELVAWITTATRPTTG